MPSGSKVGTWSSKTNDKSQWIQVDFGEVKRVTQVASQGQGLSGYAQWVTKYRVSYSTFGQEFKSQDHVSHDIYLIYQGRGPYRENVSPRSWQYD